MYAVTAIVRAGPEFSVPHLFFAYYIFLLHCSLIFGCVEVDIDVSFMAQYSFNRNLLSVLCYESLQSLLKTARRNSLTKADSCIPPQT